MTIATSDGCNIDAMSGQPLSPTQIQPSQQQRLNVDLMLIAQATLAYFATIAKIRAQ